MKKILFSSTLLLISACLFAQCNDFSVDFKTNDTVMQVMVCSPSSVLINSLVQLDAGDEVTSYDWWFGDGKTGNIKNPAHTYYDAGYYKVKLVVHTKNGCVDSMSKDSFYTVMGPKAQFSLVHDTLCSGQNLQINNESEFEFSNTATARMDWMRDGKNYFSSGQFDKIVTQRLDSAGEFELSLRITQTYKDPVTGVDRICLDYYPNSLQGEPTMKYLVKGVEEANFTRKNDKMYVNNASVYDSILWSYRDQKIISDSLNLNDVNTKTIGLLVFQNGCARYYPDILMGVPQLNTSFSQQFDFDLNGLVLNINNKSDQILYLKVFSTNGKLIASSRVKAGATLQQSLDSFDGGVYLFNITDAKGHSEVKKYLLQ
ncbi:PKD domain-containing protein [bacterium]|nr:PKD domain-containing protein [bacterium]